MIQVPNGDEHVTVRIERREASPRFVSQANCAGFGFDSPASFLAFVRRNGVPFTSSGRLRIVDAEDLAAALKSGAKCRPRKPVAETLSDLDAARKAGLRLVSKAGAK